MGVPENIKALRRNAGLSQPALAEKAGVSQQLISQLENGRNLSTKYLPQIARALGVSVAAIDPAYIAPPDALGPAVSLKDTGAPTFAGYVAAGVFRAVDEYFQQADVEVPESVRRVAAYPKARQYAYRVEGKSMDLAGIDDGMWIVAADAADFIDVYGDLESGDLVVVQRTRYQGAERELTVKEIRYYRDRYELLPRSSDPSYQPIVVPHDHQANGDEMEVQIVGVVLSAVRTFVRRRKP